MSFSDYELDADLEAGQGNKIGALYEEVETSTFKSKRSTSWVSVASKASIKDLPRKLVRGFTNNSQEHSEEAGKRPSDGREIITYLSTGQPRTTSFLDACDWYATKFVNEKYKASWHLIQPIVLNVDNGNGCPDASDFGKVDRVLATIAQALSNTKDLALVDIVDELINQNLIRDDGTDEREVSHQLMFRFLGWLTMLYDSKTECNADMLQVAKVCTNTRGNKVNLHSRTFDTYSQDFQYIDHSLHLLLGRFGKLIPDPPLRKKAEIAYPSEWIIVPFVCYQTLRHVCRVEIEWVDVLSLHLEFDSSRKVLKIFRFPSFCRLMYRHKQRGLLSQLFDDKERDLRDSPTPNPSTTSDFFREMLLTYRLLFGQDSKSHSLFAKEMASLTRKSKSKSSVFSLPDADPLLPALCARPWNSAGPASIYADILAPEIQPYYTPSTYPFFAEKLLAVQGYVRERNPHDLKTLWHNHRDKTNWWQFWAVVFIGGGTLLLGILSLVFQIVQVVLALKQLIAQENSTAAGSPLG